MPSAPIRSTSNLRDRTAALGSDIRDIGVEVAGVHRDATDPAHQLIGAVLRRYERTYRALRPLDDRAVLYYQVFRAVAQLVGVGHAGATGRVGGGAFHSAAGVSNLIALIRKLSGVSVRLEDRVPRSKMTGST